MNTNPIVPEKDPCRMGPAHAATCVQKPSTVEKIAVRGLAYAVRRWGPQDAPQLFLLHGWMDSSPTFQFVVDALQRDWQIIAPDWRGFGGSTWFGHPYWFPDYHADLEVLLDHYAPHGPVRLVGHSMGAAVAGVYAGLLLVFTALGAWTLTERVLLREEVHRDRGGLMQETTEGRIENSYTLKLINMEEATRQFRIAVSGLPGLRIEGPTEFVIEPGRVHTVTLTLSSPLEGMPSGAQQIAFETVALHDPGLAVREKSTFILPTH